MVSKTLKTMKSEDVEEESQNLFIYSKSETEIGLHVRPKINIIGHFVGQLCD